MLRGHNWPGMAIWFLFSVSVCFQGGWGKFFLGGLFVCGVQITLQPEAHGLFLLLIVAAGFSKSKRQDFSFERIFVYCAAASVDIEFVRRSCHCYICLVSRDILALGVV